LSVVPRHLSDREHSYGPLAFVSLTLRRSEVDGRSGWRFEPEVTEDTTYDGRFGESADAGDRTLVYVIGVDDRVLAIHATAPGADFARYADEAANLVTGIRFSDGLPASRQ
jgi:hypothetical protein